MRLSYSLVAAHQPISHQRVPLVVDSITPPIQKSTSDFTAVQLVVGVCVNWQAQYVHAIVAMHSQCYMCLYSTKLLGVLAAGTDMVVAVDSQATGFWLHFHLSKM
jgi:hypothetical protein